MSPQVPLGFVFTPCPPAWRWALVPCYSYRTVSRHAKDLRHLPPCPLDILSLCCLLPLCSVESPFSRELGPRSSSGFCFLLLKAAAQKRIIEVVRELAELAEELVDIVKSLQSQRDVPESGPDNDRSTLSMSRVGSAPRGKRESVCRGRG